MRTEPPGGRALLRRAFGETYGPAVSPREYELSPDERERHRAFAVGLLAESIGAVAHPQVGCAPDDWCYRWANRLHFQRWLAELSLLDDGLPGAIAAQTRPRPSAVAS